MKKLSEKVVTSGFVLALLLLGGVSVKSYLSVQELVESRRSVEHTHQVLETFNKILNGMENAERGRRGYVLLKNDRELDTLQSGIQATNQAIAQAQTLTQANPSQKRRLEQLQPLIAKRLALIEQFVGLLQQKKATPFTQRPLLKQTLILQQRIQTRLQEMDTLERTLLQQQSAAIDANVKQSIVVDGIGYFLSFSLLSSIFFLLQNQVRTRQQAEATLHQANEQLEARVEERTLELAQANAALQTELTERQQVEQSLLESAKQLRLITDAMPALISYIDSEQCYRFNNRTYEAWFGDSHKDLTGYTLRQIIGEPAYQAVRHYVEAALAGQEVCYESFIPYQDGVTRWVHATYVPDLGEQGEVKGFFALVSDIAEAKRHETERQQAEAQIRQSEERLHQVLQNMPVMLNAFDEDWNVIEWNRECERVTGYGMDVVDNPKIMELFYPNATYRQQLMQAWRDRGHYYRQWEWEFTCKDGSIKTISWSNISDQCPIPGWASWGVGVDVSDRKAAEQEIIQLNQSLNRQVKQLETLLEVIPIGIGIAHDPECKTITVNPAFAKQLGIPPTINASLSAPPDQAPGFKVYQNGRELCPEELPMQYAVAHGVEVTDVEVEVVHEDGKTVTLLEYAAPLFDEQSQIIGCVGAFLDITERKQGEQNLQQANQDLERYNDGMEELVNAVQELSVARTLETVMAIVKRAARKLTGADGATFILRDGDQCFYADEDVLGALWKGQRFPINTCISGWAMANHQPVAIAQIDQDPRIPQTIYESTFVKSLAMVPIRIHDPIGAIGNYWATHHQPTREEIALLQMLADTAAVAMDNVQVYAELEQRVQQRTAELNQVNQDLSRSNQELEQFAYVASHDLQEPLRAIIGYTQLLAKDYPDQLDAIGQQYNAYVIEGATRMQQLIQDLLEYSRVGTRDLMLAPTDCNALLKRVLDNLQRAIADSNAIITHDPLPTITADKTQMTQLFQNLVGNAIKFRREDPPQIHISATWSEAEIPDPMLSTHVPAPHVPAPHLSPNAPEWLFSIRDHGIGIKPRYLERIFEIFKRLHTRREFPGTGIGLSICKKIVDRHNGRIWAESEPGTGTTFYFTIPIPHPSYGYPTAQLDRDPVD